MKNKKSYTPDEYTYEDYLKDFELDYLGFDGVPDDPVSGYSPEKLIGNKSEQETDAPEENKDTPHPRRQKQQNTTAYSDQSK